jgi:hypothetical protein
MGRAISAWERMEMELAIIYSILTRRPGQPGAIDEYGSAGKTLDQRLDQVQAAWNQFAPLAPNQGKEADLKAAIGVLMQGVRDRAAVRARIAHGMVAEVGYLDRASSWLVAPARRGYAMVAPPHAETRLTGDRPPGYYYGTIPLTAMASDFIALANEIQNIRQKLRD